MQSVNLTPKELLALIPQQSPFRFVDEIIEVDTDHIIGCYRYRPEEYFYRGHFPDIPITPGVILLETMGQVSLVAFGIYLYHQLEQKESIPMRSVFCESNVEFQRVVRPGEAVRVEAHKVYFRRLKLKVKVVMKRADGRVVCDGSLAGVGVRSL